MLFLELALCAWQLLLPGESILDLAVDQLWQDDATQPLPAQRELLHIRGRIRFNPDSVLLNPDKQFRLF
jgi:hypothetical protein